MDNKKIYIGSGKIVEGHPYLISGSLVITDLLRYIEENPIQPYKNGKCYLNITIVTNKMPDKFGNTHSIQVNNYKSRQQDSVPF